MLLRSLIYAALYMTALTSLACIVPEDEDDEGERSPATACLAVADAVAESGRRCGGSYQQTYESFVNAAAGGSCDNIVELRDEDDLYGVCLPSLRTISCGNLFAGNLDPSCAGQLLREP